MNKLKNIIYSKNSSVIGFGLVYIILILIFKWGIKPNFNAVFFALGSVTGLFILDISEALFNIEPSPFRSVIFYVGFILVSLFVTSSSGNPLVSGMVLLMYINMIVILAGEFKSKGNIDSFFRSLNLNMTILVQKITVIMFTFIFLIESIIFVLFN
jgi:hypothetical protein